MNNKNQKYEKEEISATILLQKIKAVEMNPKLLSSEERKTCVNLLVMCEGLTHSQAAQILCCSEKTIQRYIAEIRKENSLNPSLELVKELAGDVLVKAEIHISHLMRLSRSKEGSLGERAQAEFLAWKVKVDLIGKLQSFGYLPLVAQRIEGDLFHHLDGNAEEKDLSELKNALCFIEVAAKESGTLDGETEEKIKRIKSKIDKAEIELAVDDLNKKQAIKSGEESNENRKDQ